MTFFIISTPKSIHLPFLRYHSTTPIISTLKTSLTPPTMASPASVSVSVSVSKSDTTSSTQHDDSEILHEFLFFNVYKDGRVTVFAPPMQTLPAKDDPTTGVQIKDVQISDIVTVRMFHPPTTTPATKLPVLLYVHGGGFCMQSAFSVEYTRFLTRLVSAGKIIAVSVEYGLFPARPIPACYEDSWEALKWVVSESGLRSDPWASHADVTGVYIAGDSAGGNICHTLAAWAGTHGLPAQAKLKGAILVHPYFGEDDKMWMYMCPTNEGSQDPRMKPAKEDLARIGCEKVLVLIGEKDGLREAGEMYVDELMKSGWSGNVEVMVNKDKDHCFHLGCPDDLEALAIQNRIISFIHHNDGDHLVSPMNSNGWSFSPRGRQIHLNEGSCAPLRLVFTCYGRSVIDVFLRMYAWMLMQLVVAFLMWSLLDYLVLDPPSNLYSFMGELSIALLECCFGDVLTL